MFSQDRGLRDGDWKLVSFQGRQWELYHLAVDRFETNNLAAKHPDIVARMSEEWHRMAREEVLALGKEQQPVSDKGPPHTNPEWTNFNKPAPR